MFQVINCETRGDTPHEWITETILYNEGHRYSYSSGFMRQRRCTKCKTAEYIKYVSLDLNTIIDIEGPLIEVGLRDPSLPK